ncbi:sensor histidine kinase [Martelella endophytica]|uniref:histidine kinase n=1 Tax=Martelella endophytica TaxID=1486262 RepID=A0A0D5LV17_MAREN|nr:HAMP domain-containing sensor histidine kinase [Martelella endophytica]AJY47223.1 histidine kinase [Martelella endophytica]
MRFGNSVTFRSLALTTAWFVIALLVIAIVISALYRNAAERGFRQLLQAEMFNVINSVSVDDNGELKGAPQLGNLNYQQPQTGWYWVVDPLYDPTKETLHSPSLGDTDLPRKSEDEVPYDGDFRRTYIVRDNNDNDVAVIETVVVMDEKDRAARIRVTGNRETVDDEVRWFSHRLYLALALFGAASVLLNGLVILWALSPLDKARRALSQISESGEGEMKGAFPHEVQPLADEINALLSNNRAIIERARMQVGNLAHSLKTPIAVLLNEAQRMSDKEGKLITSQVVMMQSQVQAYLNRARIAAQSESVLTRCDVQPTLERLVRVMRRLNPDTEFSFSCEAGLVLATEQQDLEEVVGNLLENAGRFARYSVEVKAHRLSETNGDGAGWAEITVVDDGPGLTPEEIRKAMKRGERLDESGAGSGLGLSIVDDIVQAYGGRFELTGLEGAGLHARVVLPAKG